METIAISKFEATCFAVLEEVRRTGQGGSCHQAWRANSGDRARLTAAEGKRRLGMFAQSGRIVGDIVTPAADEGDWETLEL